MVVIGSLMIEVVVDAKARRLRIQGGPSPGASAG